MQISENKSSGSFWHFPGVFRENWHFTGVFEDISGSLVPQPSLIFESKKLRNVNLPRLPAAAALQASTTNSNNHANLDGKREDRNLFYYQKILPGIPGFKY